MLRFSVISINFKLLKQGAIFFKIKKKEKSRYLLVLTLNLLGDNSVVRNINCENGLGNLHRQRASSCVLGKRLAYFLIFRRCRFNRLCLFFFHYIILLKIEELKTKEEKRNLCSHCVIIIKRNNNWQTQVYDVFKSLLLVDTRGQSSEKN